GSCGVVEQNGLQAGRKGSRKLEFLRMLARMKLDPARMELLAVFFETYLKLNREEEEQLYRELGKMDKKEVDAIMQITTSWHEKGRAEGRAEGRMEGRMEKAREIICKYLSRKFGDKSAGLQQKVERMTDLETLDYILEQLFAASTLEEARVIINNGVRER
ncbi:MAG: DUF4351 domain-containing protein, partial [Desulfofundulus sp.]